MVSSFVIAEGKQRTAEGYGSQQRTPEGYRSRLGPVGYFFVFPTSYVGNPLLRQAAEEGGQSRACVPNGRIARLDRCQRLPFVTIRLGPTITKRTQKSVSCH